MVSRNLSSDIFDMSVQRSATTIFLGCMTRPRAQRRVTQPVGNTLWLITSLTNLSGVPVRYISLTHQVTLYRISEELSEAHQDGAGDEEAHSPGR